MSDPKKLRERGSSPRKAGSDNFSVELQKLRVSRIRRVSDPGSSDAGRESAPADDDVLSLRLGRLHVATGAAARAAAASACLCGRRCRSPGAPGCRRRWLVLRPARLKPTRRPLLREPRLLRPAAAAAAAAATRGSTAAASPVFGGTVPERCSEFGQLTTAPLPAAGAPETSPFAGTGAPVFATSAAVSGGAAEPQSDSPPTTTCSVQHRQRRPASVDELAGLVAQVSIMSSMAEMMYT